MSTRIAARFAALKAEGRAGLAAFVTAGDPDRAVSEEILAGLPAAGADIVELGMPFSDPMADGPAVQASSLRALRSGANMRQTLDLVRSFREADDETPVILMGYFNPIYRYGAEAFLADAKAAGVDGLIIVDLPPEEDELAAPMAKAGIDLIYLIAPTTNDARLPFVVERAGGFVYYVSITGITGTHSADAADMETAVARIRKATPLPVVVGFGIKTPAQAAEVGRFADAIAVGSAIVGRVADNVDETGKPKPGCAEAVLDLVRDLAGGLRNGAE